MNMSIVNWTNVGLVYVMLVNTISVISLKVMPFVTSNIEYPIFNVISVILSIAAIVGLVRKYTWARIAALAAISLTALPGLCISIYLLLETQGQVELRLLLFPFIYDIPLLFLLYKVYLSDVLKLYLTNPLCAETNVNA
jgi:hypothetical protein